MNFRGEIITAHHGYVEGAPYWVTLAEWESDLDDDLQFIAREREQIWRAPAKTAA